MSEQAPPLEDLSPIDMLRRDLARGDRSPESVANAALACANSNAGANVYLAGDTGWTLEQARALADRHRPPSRAGAAQPKFQNRIANPIPQALPLFGVPVSLKDCFDLAGFATSCGLRFYAENNAVAADDSAVAARLRQAGAVLTGKTHLHQLAYGITGENPDYGDCAQPGDAALLTGGSSSGAAASVLEGSALAAIGTDTGGSIRVPAALCGLAGYRSSHGLADSLGLWDGAFHLAPSFDTLGWIFRDLRDGPLLANALFGLDPEAAPAESPRVGCVDLGFLEDCGADVLAAYEGCKRLLRSQGASLCEFDAGFWNASMEIFAPIQAHEAAAIHQGNFHRFERGIADRLAWGESITEAEIAALRVRHADFRARMDALFVTFDFLLLPASPMSSLALRADHSAARRTILRYTTPISLGGMPTVTLPGEGGGMQLAGARADDARLLGFAASLPIG